MFKLVEAHLKKIGKNELLPAGIILTGGGSSVQSMAELAKAMLKLPSRLSSLTEGPQRMQLRDSSWSVAYGLTVWGFSEGDGLEGVGGGSFNDSVGKLWSWFKKFLP